MKPTTAVALSGGIDSLVAAHLLKTSGHEIFGLHFVTGYDPLAPEPSLEWTDSKLVRIPSEHPLSVVKDQLNTEIWAVDCREVFKEKVIDYFIHSYMTGKTPNPCMACNAAIKFGGLLETARHLGASHLATGHYAIVEKSKQNVFQLKKGRDPAKEQSYFLAMLTQDQLAHALFPVGRMTKAQVGNLAQANGLTPVSGNESQDICFIKNMHYSRFLAEQAGLNQTAGAITDLHGRRLGTHHGLHRYTIGQRRGINCPGPEPYYVVRLDVRNNRLIVGTKKDLYQSACKIHPINWLSEVPENSLPVMTKLRYRHEAAESKIFPAGKNSAEIRFTNAQPAVTPGQAAVCYYGDQVVAGGWIVE
ncbi:MAG: tRNA 2-thiouridine(34) synthase MnmA [Desulfobacterales bacterium]|nr:tRNA 2-thiouridine(34) synthase MnmA [Desulfobacterales bacterium]